MRNTLRFLLANLADFDPARDALPVDEWLEIDRYAWVMTHDLQRELAPSERAKTRESAGTTAATSSTWSCRSCRPSAPRTSAASISTC